MITTGENNRVFLYSYIVKKDVVVQECNLQIEEVDKIEYHTIEWLEELMRNYPEKSIFNVKSQIDQIMINDIKSCIQKGM